MGALVVEQSKIESEFPPSTASAVPLPPRGTAFSRLLLCSRWGGGDVLLVFVSLY